MSDSQIIATVFGSSRPSDGEADYAEARELGWALAAKGFTVCSGGYGGVMEAVSRGAKDAGGSTLGITAKFFGRDPNRWVDKVIQVNTWQERLFALIEEGNCYVICKGGTGTLVELSVVWEMLNKGVMRRKPCVAIGEFWRPIVESIREVEQGHSSPWAEMDERLLYIAANPQKAVEYLLRELWRLDHANDVPAAK
ncbi:MAG: LOG family protein [Acidobacteria bacterium]|nr:LOG family protein [Acidobacteriota bacterium]